MPELSNAITRSNWEKHGELPSVLDFIPAILREDIRAGSCVADLTEYFQNALDTGNSIFVPRGTYLISQVELASSGQVLYGEGRGLSRICKFSDTPIVFVNAGFAGLRDISLYGNYDAFGDGALVRPVGAPSFLDTTDGVVIGVHGSGQPFQWILKNCLVYCNGRDGVHWIDGPSPIIDGLFSSYNARWGWWTNQIVYMAGPGSEIDASGNATDTSHAHIGRIECIRNGRGTYTAGGGVLLQGNSHTIANLKLFESWGDGLVMSSHSSRAKVFVELVGRGNTVIPAWVTGTAYAAGDMVRSSNTVYVATTTGTSGGTAPTHTSGTASDGGVTWGYRRGIGVVVTSEFYQCNKVDMLFTNTDDGYLVSGENEISGFSHSADPGFLGQNLAAVKTLRVSRTIDFANVDGGGSYEAIMLRPKPGGGSAREFELSGQGSADTFDLFVGDGTQGLVRLRQGNAYIADIPIGCKAVEVAADYTLFEKSVADGDTYLVDASGAARTFNLWKGGDGAVALARVITVVKTDSSANKVTIFAPDSPGHLLSTTKLVTGTTDYVELLAQYELRTFLLIDATNGVWQEIAREDGLDASAYCLDPRKRTHLVTASGTPAIRLKDSTFDHTAYTNYYGAAAHATAGLTIEFDWTAGTERKGVVGMHQPNGAPETFLGSPSAVAVYLAGALAARIASALTGSRFVKTDGSLNLVSGKCDLGSASDVQGTGLSTNHVPMWDGTKLADLTALTATRVLISNGSGAIDVLSAMSASSPMMTAGDGLPTTTSWGDVYTNIKTSIDGDFISNTDITANYYSKAEIDTILAGYATTGALATKSNAGHNHSYSGTDSGGDTYSGTTDSD